MSYTASYLKEALQAPVSISPEVPVTHTGEPLIDVTNPRHREALEKLEQGYERACSTEGFKSYLNVLSHLYQYSPRNIALIFSQRPDATAVNSYDRWQNAGRQVKKGSQGIRIFYPQFQLFNVENETTGEVERHKIVKAFGIGNVFDISDTDGPPLEPPKPPQERFNTTEEAVAIDRAVSSFLIGEGIRVEKKPTPKVRGYFDPEKREIALNEDLPDDDGKAKTLVHETAHYVAGDKAGYAGRNLREFVAEASTYAALLTRGVDTSEYSIPYIQWWTRDPRMMSVAMPRIARVTKQLVQIMDHEDPSTIEEWL